MRGVSALAADDRTGQAQDSKPRADTPHPSASGAHLLPQGEKEKKESPIRLKFASVDAEGHGDDEGRSDLFRPDRGGVQPAAKDDFDGRLAEAAAARNLADHDAVGRLA